MNAQSMPSVVAHMNWMPDSNRFGLPVPPAWFLKALWDLDAGLVVIPSRQTRKYLLARRRSQSKTLANIHQQVINERVHQRVKYSDSDMLAGLSLVAVDSISGNVYNGSWMRSCPAILSELRSRDMWAAGGAQKYIDQIEADEAKLAAKKRADLLDNCEHRASDAWRSYQARSGARNQRASGSTRAKVIPVGTL